MPEYLNRLVCRSPLFISTVSLLCGAIFSLQATAAGLSGFDALLQKAQDQGQVRVIVTMQKLDLPARASMSAKKFDNTLAESVSAMQSAVINSIPKNAIIGKLRRFMFTPQFALNITPAGLTTLRNNPSVIAIQEDIPVPPLLDISVPRIFPSHDTSNYSGNGWAVAILDTGVDKTHSFLKDGIVEKVISEACYSTTFAPNDSTSVCPGGVPSSTATDSGLPCPTSTFGCDHGTHVAGIAAGNGATFNGVAKDANLIAIQVFSEFTDPICASIGVPSPCAFTYTSDQIAGLDRVYGLRSTYNIASVNMSLGGGQYTDFCDDDSRKPSIDNLKSAGIATVIASGNDGFNSSVSTPACISTGIAVGSTSDTADTRSSFSNNGPQLDLYAPGESINSSVPGDGFQSKNGTSMAAPHVAGAWAVLKQRYPSRSVDEIEAAFKATGVTVTSSLISRQRINIDEALGFYSLGYQYTPLTPCRIVDTRNAGGMIEANSSRAFFVNGTDAEIQSQGGTGNCGVPQDAVAVVLNITSHQSSAQGNFKVYPYNEPVPNTSILNFSLGLTIANSTTTPICQPLCLRDISIYSLVTSHLIIDVMGYMQ